MKLKNKMELYETLLRENYDRITVDTDTGNWWRDSCSTVYENGATIFSFSRSNHYNLTTRQAKRLIASLQSYLDGDGGAEWYRMTVDDRYTKRRTL